MTIRVYPECDRCGGDDLSIWSSRTPVKLEDDEQGVALPLVEWECEKCGYTSSESVVVVVRRRTI